MNRVALIRIGEPLLAKISQRKNVFESIGSAIQTVYFKSGCDEVRLFRNASDCFDLNTDVNREVRYFDNASSWIRTVEEFAVGFV